MSSFQGVHRVVLTVRTPNGITADAETTSGAANGTNIEFDKPVNSLNVTDLRFLVEVAQRGRRAYLAAEKASPDVYTE